VYWPSVVSSDTVIECTSHYIQTTSVVSYRLHY